MEEEQKEYLEPRRLSLELLASIRNLDSRIDELNMIALACPKYKDEDRRHTTVKRIASLLETRSCLVYSFMDINGIKRSEFNANPFADLHITTIDLKRPLKIKE